MKNDNNNNERNKMNFAAEIVVRKNGSSYVAGFASKTGKGEKVSSYGKWFGSQMSYRPFSAAMKAAQSEAARLNGGAK